MPTTSFCSRPGLWLLQGGWGLLWQEPEDGPGGGSSTIQPPPNKKQKKIDLDRELPKFSRTLDKDLANLNKLFEAAQSKVDSVFKDIDEVELKLVMSDVAFLGLVRSFELRLHFLHRWNGAEPTSQSVHEVLKKPYDAAIASGSGSDIKMEKKNVFDQGLQEFIEHAGRSAEGIIEACKDRLPVKEPPNFDDSEHLVAARHSVLSLQTVDDLEKFKSDWTATTANVSSLATSLRKVASDVCEHMKTRAREAQRAELRRQNAEKQEALKKVREEASKAAAEIRKKSIAVGPQLPVLSADFSMVPAVPAISKLSDVQSMPSEDWSKPWMLKKTDEVQLCLGDGQLQKSFTTFALQCKKAKEQQGGRHQYNLAAGSVKDTVDAVLAKIMPKADAILGMAKLVENGDKFTQSTWLYAYATDMVFVGLPPNGCAQVRVQATGTVECIIIDLKSFVAAMSTDAKLTLTALHKELGQANDVQPFLDKNINMWRHTLSVGEVLYLPTGVGVIEKCPPDQSFIYGMRKSFLCKTGASAYAAVLKLFAEDGRNVDKMRKIHEALSSFGGGGAPAEAEASKLAVPSSPERVPYKVLSRTAASAWRCSAVASRIVSQCHGVATVGH